MKNSGPLPGNFLFYNRVVLKNIIVNSFNGGQFSALGRKH